MPVIVISGPPGVGSSTVSRRVAEELGLDYFSPGKLIKERAGGDNETIAATEGWETGEISGEDLNQSIDDLQKKMAEQGDVVIDGKLSIHMVDAMADLKVWLEAPLRVRAQRAAKRDGISEEEAKEMMQQRQRDQIECWQDMYGFNYMEQKDDADIVIDTAERPPEEIAEIIVSKVE